MTRRRRVPLVLGVRIGVFLLLFSTITADTTKDPSTSLEKVLSPNVSEATISETSKTIINKISSKDEAEPTSQEKKDKATDSFAKKDFETFRDELTKDDKTEDEEKVPMPIDQDSNVQGIRSRDQVDKLSTVDSTNGAAKLEEIVYGTSGKSSSTKSVTENIYRLSRTNGLTTVTTKSSLEEAKLDEKNKTSHAPSSNETLKLESYKSVLPLEDGLELKEENREGTEKSELETFQNKMKTNSGLRQETTNAKSDSAAEKVRFLEGFQERRKKSETLSPVKNSEVPDLKEADEDNRNDGSISLINDTDVNYNHQYKTSTDGNLVKKPGNQSRTFDNSPASVTHETPNVDPKDEVEVVANVTHSAIERIVEQKSQNLTPKDTSLLNEVSERSRTNENEDSLRNSTETIKVDTNQQTPQQIVTHTSTTPRTPSSPVPRGRTIAFSGANEFPGIEAEPTVSSKLDISFTKRNATEKPYPYIKTPMKDQLPNSSNEVDVTTEEPSALENTIGKGQSEEKFIVTEASDVLENSIQQFKPTYFEKVNNESTVSSTDIRSSVPMTTASLARLEEASPTNQTTIDKSSDSNGIVKPEEKSKNEGNDVPRWSEGHDAITGKGSFDVTGNGITEVSLKPESDKLLQEIASRTTPAPLTTESSAPQMDVQTNAEGSLLIRSTLNATELSTEYPLVKENSTDSEKSVIPQATTVQATTSKVTESASVLATSIEETSVGNVTEAPRNTADINGTNKIPSGVSGTFGPDESFVATTTGIEYEFVGLTESTTFIARNSTEVNEASEVQSGAFTVVPTVHDLLTKNGSSEVTTWSNEVTTESTWTPSSTENGEVTDVDDRVSSIPVTDPTIASTMQSRDESTTPSIVIDEDSDRSKTKDDEVRKTTSLTVDSWSTTTEGDTVTMGVITEVSVSSDSKDSRFAMNVTEAPVEFTSISNVNATDATRVATSDSFVPSSLRPRIPTSSSTSSPTASDVPTEKADDVEVVTSEQGEITSLVQIDMEGSWYDVCPKKDKLKLSLAEIFKSGMNKSVSDNQIMFHQDPCEKSPNSTPTPSDVPLMSMWVYVVDENGKFDAAMTKILPTLYEDFRDRVKFPVTIHRFLLVQETIPDSGNAIAVIVVSSVAFICLILLAGLLFIMRKRQTRFNYGERCRPVSLDAYSLDSVSAYNSVRRKGVARSSKRSYGNPTFEDSSAIPSHPLNFAGLSSFCNDVNSINEEFSGIPQVSAKIDELPTGAEVKNRYANVIPLPETRVPLQKINNDPLSEYINASYVRGPKNATRYYIACQAPMESTVTDFWRMIWEQQCKVIIMLTDLVENGVEKCTEYVPPSEITDCHRLYGDYQVTLKKTETKEKYAISTLHLKNLENNTFREVYHIWYLWPVNGVQSDGAGLIAVLLEARALQRGGPGPIVVHCSPGTGRTGTLIALDLGIRQYEITRTVDVPRVVYTIRRDRAGAVQTKEQYAFIYKALNLYATKLAGGVLEST